MTTDPTREAIKARLAAATMTHQWESVRYDSGQIVIVTVDATIAEIVTDDLNTDPAQNADLIANAPTDLRYLLDQLEAAEEREKVLVELIGRLDWGNIHTHYGITTSGSGE